MAADTFALEQHALYFKKNMRKMPGAYATMDTNRLTLLYFSISGLDLLDRLNDPDIDKKAIIRYIYSYQSTLADNGGFYGYPHVKFESEDLDKRNNQPHLANTYVALIMLIILGDDLRGVNRDSLRYTLRKCQLESGCFCCVNSLSPIDSENDMRFVYCAASICYILDLWDAIDVEKMYQFILASQSFDGAFGICQESEAHGGCTYCATASLAMMGRLGDVPRLERLIDWCVKRQELGFQGRIEKPMDSCYSFWIGGSLKLLDVQNFLNAPRCAEFLKKCESPVTGGFKKVPENPPDLLHSYFSICGLSLCGLLQPLNVKLSLSERAFSCMAEHFRMAAGGKEFVSVVRGEGDTLENTTFE